MMIRNLVAVVVVVVFFESNIQMVAQALTLHDSSAGLSATVAITLPHEECCCVCVCMLI